MLSKVAATVRGARGVRGPARAGLPSSVRHVGEREAALVDGGDALLRRHHARDVHALRHAIARQAAQAPTAEYTSCIGSSGSQEAELTRWADGGGRG